MTPIFKIAKLFYNIINIYISVVVFKIIPELAKYWRHFLRQGIVLSLQGNNHLLSFHKVEMVLCAAIHERTEKRNKNTKGKP